MHMEGGSSQEHAEKAQIVAASPSRLMFITTASRPWLKYYCALLVLIIFWSGMIIDGQDVVSTRVNFVPKSTGFIATGKPHTLSKKATGCLLHARLVGLPNTCARRTCDCLSTHAEPCLALNPTFTCPPLMLSLHVISVCQDFSGFGSKSLRLSRFESHVRRNQWLQRCLSSTYLDALLTGAKL